MDIDNIVAGTADPGTARERIEDILITAPEFENEEEFLRAIAHLFAGSDYLSRWLLHKPDEIRLMLAEGAFFKPRGTEEMAKCLDNLMKNHTPMSALRRFKNRELCRIATRELAGLAPVDETLREWSKVADTAIDAAIKVAMDQALAKYGTPVYTDFESSEEKIAGFGALAMGKLGGEELNISSDVDIIYVHSSDNGMTTGNDLGENKITLHQFFVIVAREATRLLTESTEDGIVFRVDLDLRPEGRSGEITNSVGAMEVYYESWGQQWERQALIKARHCGGSAEVIRETLARLKPFMFRKYYDQRAIDEIAAMKEKIDLAQKAKKGAKATERNIKLGPGGIREIEFVAQALQLLYGARYKEMQTRSTLKALDVAHSLRLLSAPHHRDLREAYIFYRRLENRIQYHHLSQTHSLPENAERLAVLARQMKFDSKNLALVLMEDVRRRQKRVRGIFDLFFQKGAKEPTETFPVSLDDEETTAAWLDSLHFDRPEDCAKSLNALRNGRTFQHPSERSKTDFDQFGPFLVNTAAKTPWPDNVIIRFDEFVDTKGARDMLYEMLNKHRPILGLLSAVFSSSESLTAALMRQPDLVDRLLMADPVGNPPNRYRYSAEFRGALSRDSDIERKIENINSFRAVESFRLGLGRLLDLSDKFDVMTGLTILAEEYIKSVVEAAKNAIAAPEPADAKYTILAAGKLGRREINYGSDVDLLVFCEGSEEAIAYATTLTQSLIKLSGHKTSYGSGYSVDMRLRPYGEKGPLVPTFASMRNYYKGEADEWERLALVGTRPILGDPEFSQTVMNTLSEFIFAPPMGSKDYAKTAAIRERIADEKVRHGTVDTKFGRGGLIEIEFICQWLAMEHLGDSPGKWPDGPFTHTMIGLGLRHKWLKPEVAAELEKAYEFYRSIEDALRMDRERSINAVPQKGTALRRLARAVNAPGAGPERFVAAVKDTMSRVREIYLHFVKERTG